MKQNKSTYREGMDVKEMADYLGISYATAFKLTQGQGFPCVRIGKRRIIPKTLLMKWLEEQARR